MKKITLFMIFSSVLLFVSCSKQDQVQYYTAAQQAVFLFLDNGSFVNHNTTMTFAPHFEQPYYLEDWADHTPVETHGRISIEIITSGETPYTNVAYYWVSEDGKQIWIASKSGVLYLPKNYLFKITGLNTFTLQEIKSYETSEVIWTRQWFN
ncbi:MAG: hypothetical protein PHT14_04335 [Petrimonas sp.]|nr:hypothetical protein [Petrimonas sp.]MDD3542632.1 hypothetical protein [Petrimonas sp.]